MKNFLPSICAFNILLLLLLIHKLSKSSEFVAEEHYLDNYKHDQSIGYLYRPECKLKHSKANETINERLFYDDEGNWRFKYLSEQTDGFEVLVEDESIDERLSNVIHTVYSIKVVDFSHHRYASGDTHQDEAMLQLVGSPGGPVDDELCGMHLTEMLNQMEDLNERLERKRTSSELALNLTEQHYRLARVLDSFGRYESGHLLGKNYVPGSYDECISSRLLLPVDKNYENVQLDINEKTTSSVELVAMRFCWASFTLDRHMHPSLRQRERHELEAKHESMLAGICLPQTCHSRSYRKHPHLLQAIARSQFKLPKNIYLDEHLELDSVFCPSDNENLLDSLPFSGKLWFGFVSLWILFAIYATYFRETSEKDKGGRENLLSGFFDCLNLRESWADFIGSRKQDNKDDIVADKQAESRVNLDMLNPIKVLGTMYVVYGHAIVFEMATTMDTIRSYHQAELDPIFLLIVVGVVVIDSFIVITGIIMAYVVVSKEFKQRYDKQQHSSWTDFFKKWALIVLSRYLRLLPLYYLMFWFQKAVMMHLNTHLPFWDSGLNKDTVLGACKQETWLSPLILTTPYLPISRQCMSESWTIAVDLTFALTLTPIILIFNRRPKLATTISLALCLFSVLWGYRSFYELDASCIDQMSDVTTHGFAKMFTHAGHLYTYPLGRFCPILVGFIIGYHLSRYNQGEKSKDWPDWLKGLVTNISIFAMLGALALWPQIPLIKRLASPYHKTSFVHIVSTFRFVWSLANGIVFMRLVSDWKTTNDSIRGFCLHKFWKVLVKLGYAILLIHMIVFMYDVAVQKSVTGFSIYRATTRANSVYFVCLPISVLLHVLFENPVDKMVKRLILRPIVRREKMD